MPSLTTLNFVEEFCQVLDSYGDMYFPMDGAEKDLGHIKATIESQGYWAGTSQRYYFDMDAMSRDRVKLLRTEERRFG